MTPEEKLNQIHTNISSYISDIKLINQILGLDNTNLNTLDPNNSTCDQKLDYLLSSTNMINTNINDYKTMLGV